jgi:YaiO family outer membrane protein
VKKAKVLYALKRYSEASLLLSKVLSINKKNAQARALAEQISDATANNRIGVSYAYTHFDKQYPDPWNLMSLEYSRVMGSRSATVRMNYANRFKKDGLQFEAEAYPRFSKTFYTYVNLGFSADTSLFPRWRGGFSLYANLPNSFEAEAGTRVLHFSATKWLYTLYLGKYYRNFLFGVRTFLSASGNNIAQSYNLMTRYYYGGVEDYIALNIGTGLSPDDRASTILLNSKYKLRSTRASAACRKSFRGGNVISLNAGWIGSEYRLNEKGNQFEAGISYQRRF